MTKRVFINGIKQKEGKLITESEKYMKVGLNPSENNSNKYKGNWHYIKIFERSDVLTSEMKLVLSKDEMNKTAEADDIVVEMLAVLDDFGTHNVISIISDI